MYKHLYSIGGGGGAALKEDTLLKDTLKKSG